MNDTLGNILLSQSPALFLAAVLLIVRYFILRKNHRFHAVLDLILGILCIAGGVALYFLGINSELFTIKDFWQVRTAGYVGMIIVLVLFLILLFRSVKNAVIQHREERAARGRETAHQKELEEVRQKAYADGMADAMAVETKLPPTEAPAVEPAQPPLPAEEPNAPETAE